METIKSFFFDTYALLEIISGNLNYSHYMSGVSVVTTKLNLMELHYCLLRTSGKAKADSYFDSFNEFCVKYNDDIVKEANELKLKLNKRDLSYVDCIGYTVAKRLGIKFLTGDKQFKDLDNVEFVK
jgi:predicted nucleic acid-binding protein